MRLLKLVTSQLPQLLRGIFLNTGLQVQDTDASHVLTIAPGSNLSATRTLTLTTGDADRTVTLSGNPTLNDWFDQSVKAAASPSFAGVTVTGAANLTGGVVGGAHFLIGAQQFYATDADVNDLTLNATTSILVGNSASAPRTIHGITGGAQSRVLLFANRSGSSYLFPNDSGSAQAANQIRTGNSATVTVRTNGSAILFYNDSRWHLVSI